MAICNVDERSPNRYESDSRKRVTLKIKSHVTASKIAAKLRPPQTDNINSRKNFHKATRRRRGRQAVYCTTRNDVSSRSNTELGKGCSSRTPLHPSRQEGATPPPDTMLMRMVFFPPCIGAFAPLLTPTIEKKGNAVKISSLPVYPSKPAMAGSPPRFYITQHGKHLRDSRKKQSSCMADTPCLYPRKHAWVMQVILLPALAYSIIYGLHISEGVLPVPPALGAYAYMHQLPPRANSGRLIPIKEGRLDKPPFFCFCR